MKAEKLNGEVITIRYGEKLGGIGLLSITLEAEDFEKFFQPENLAWFETTVATRMVKKDQRAKI